MAISLYVKDAPLENSASQIYTLLLNLSQLLSAQAAQAHSDSVATQQALATVNASLQRLAGLPSRGVFNPPPALMKSQSVEVVMSVLQLEVGQVATGDLTFNEPQAPSDGAVASDNPAVTVTLAANPTTSQLTRWAATAVSVTAAGTPANITYTGTSVAPDVGPAVVAPMMVTVVPVPVAEQGDFNPAGATITGP